MEIFQSAGRWSNPKNSVQTASDLDIFDPGDRLRDDAECQHHTTLHQEKEQATQNLRRQDRNVSAIVNAPQTPAQAPHQEAGQQEMQQNLDSVVSMAVASSAVLLATAMIKIISPTGKSIVVRAFLDAGADTSFVSQAVIQAIICEVPF